MIYVRKLNDYKVFLDFKEKPTPVMPGPQLRTYKSYATALRLDDFAWLNYINFQLRNFY